MTMQNLASFGAALDNDQALRDGLEQRVDGTTGEDRVAAIADFATAKGYDVTPQEVGTGLDALRRMQDDDGELSDGELELVAGGKGASQIMQDLRKGFKTGGSETKQFFQGLIGH